MEFDHLSISKFDHAKEPQGEIRFKAYQGAITIKLTPDDCRRMLAVVADRMTAQLRDACNEMQGAVVEAASPALPSPPRTSEAEDDIPF